jgi:hypothetical protein
MRLYYGWAKTDASAADALQARLRDFPNWHRRTECGRRRAHRRYSGRLVNTRAPHPVRFALTVAADRSRGGDYHMRR